MNAITFDTLKFVEKLKAAGVPDAQARAEAEALVEALGTTEVAIKRDLMELKVDLLKWIIGLILGQTALLLTVLPKLVHP